MAKEKKFIFYRTYEAEDLNGAVKQFENDEQYLTYENFYYSELIGDTLLHYPVSPDKFEYPKISLFITKKKLFRVKIKESESEPEYEVTIGGKDWCEGKGRRFEQRIYKLYQIILIKLNNQSSHFKVK